MNTGFEQFIRERPAEETAIGKAGALMRTQASTLDMKKQAIDRVQEIVWQQEPFIYHWAHNTV